MHFIIHEPIWGGGRRCVGLADEKLEEHNTFEITYTDRFGNRVYPKTYGISKESAQKCKLIPPNGNRPALRIIPLEDHENKDKEGGQVVLRVHKEERQPHLPTL